MTKSTPANVELTADCALSLSLRRAVHIGQIVLSLSLLAFASQATLSSSASGALEVAISIPAQDTRVSGQESRRLNFRPFDAHIHVLISNNSTNEIRLWKEDCSWGYEALSFQLIDIAGKHSTVKKKPRNWRTNYPRWWLLKPKDTLIIDVYFADTKLWDGFNRPPKDSELRLKLTAIFEITSDEQTREHQIWTGKIMSAPIEVVFTN